MNKHIEPHQDKIEEKTLEDLLNNGYELLHTGGGQIFPRAGWYLQKLNPTNGKVEDIFYLDEFVQKKVDAGYQRGREDLQKEIAHEQRKLLDGFAHPKDCPQCSPLPEYPREV